MAAVSFAAILAFFFFLATMLPGCGARWDEPYCGLQIGQQVQSVIGGNTVPDSQRGSTARIRIGRGRLCSGNVLSPYTISTAGHCVRDANAPIRALVDGHWFPVVQESSNQWDIAVLTSVSELPGPYLKIIEKTEPPNCLSTLVTKGYGQNDEGLTGVLNARIVEEVGHTDNLIYTTEGSCFGDSGSGLITYVNGQSRLLGISSKVSAGKCEQGRSAWGAAYVNMVTAPGDWIAQRVCWDKACAEESAAGKVSFE